MESQLGQWRIRIELLAKRCNTTRVGPGFDAIMRVDELKALHAIATARLAELSDPSNATRRAELEIDVIAAWEDLRAALETS